MKHVFTHSDGNTLIDIADEVERLFGFGCCQVSVSPTISGLWVDERFPTYAGAFAYARELVAAAQEGSEAYRAAIR